jgi:hypothetical protein
MLRVRARQASQPTTKHQTTKNANCIFLERELHFLDILLALYPVSSYQTFRPRNICVPLTDIDGLRFVGGVFRSFASSIGTRIWEMGPTAVGTDKK